VRYFEDYRIGEVLDLGAHRFSEDEIIAYARRYNPQAFHVDPETAKESIYGGVIASGWHTCAVLMRLTVAASEREGAASLGSPGVESCRWVAPVRPGDTVSGRSEVLALWPSRTKPYGFARRRVELQNQRGETVMALTGLLMYQCRPA
jgi:acyl dehydratase